MHNYKIIDDFLPQQQWQQLHDAVTSEQGLTWQYSARVARRDQQDTNPQHCYFYHLFYDNHTWSSTRQHLVQPLIDGLPFLKSLIRVKANLYPNTPTVEYHDWHADTDYPHLGAIYYINSNNGYTVLEDNTHIASTANRLLLFEAYRPHRSTTCSDATARFNINFNYF